MTSEKVAHTHRPDLNLIEYPKAYFNHRVLNSEQAAEIQAMVENLDEYQERGPDAYLARIREIHTAFPETVVRLDLNVIDGTGEFLDLEKNDHLKKIRMRINTLFQGERSNAELDRLSELKKQNPDLRITMAFVHGGTARKWNIFQKGFLTPQWTYSDIEGKSKSMADLLKTLAAETDVVILVSCNEDDYVINNAPVETIYNLGILTMFDSEGTKHSLQRAPKADQGVYSETKTTGALQRLTAWLPRFRSKP